MSLRISISLIPAFRMVLVIADDLDSHGIASPSIGSSNNR